MEEPVRCSKYWKSLLLKWREQGHDGLTIPFIIGSQKYFSGRGETQSFQDLLAAIAADEEQEVYLNYCLTINDLILGIRSGSKLKLPVRNVAFNGTPSSLYIYVFK